MRLVIEEADQDYVIVFLGDDPTEDGFDAMVLRAVEKGCPLPYSFTVDPEGAYGDGLGDRVLLGVM
jgi:hypothetical protein